MCHLRFLFTILIFIGTYTIGFSQGFTGEEVIAGQPNILVTEDNFNAQRRLCVDVDQSSKRRVFVWQEADATGSSNKNIKCAVYTESMVLISSFTVNASTGGDQMNPTVKVNPQDNSFIVAWSSWINNTNPNDANKYDIYAKKLRFDNLTSDASASDFLVNNSYVTGRQVSPQIAIDTKQKEAIIAWIDQDGRDRLPTVVTDIDYGSYARRLSIGESGLSYISGAGEFIINTQTVSHQSVMNLAISPVTDRLYTVCGSYNYQASSDYDIVVREFSRDASGNFTGQAEFIANTYSSGLQHHPHIAINSVTGDYAICWTSETQDGDGRGAYMKVYDKYNTNIKVETRINQSIANNQLWPKGAWDEYSNLLFFSYWYSVIGNTDIRIQQFDGNHNYSGLEFDAVTLNLDNYYAGAYFMQYEQSTSKILLSMDLFSGTNSKGYFRQVKFNKVTETATSSTSDMNYVETNTILKKDIKSEYGLYTYSQEVVSTSRTYIDGLGRPVQEVIKNGSPQKKDIVKPIEYDQFGREIKSYLHYADVSMDGAYKNNCATAQASFYNNNTSNNADKVVNDAYPFAVSVYDNSPLNRVIKTYPEGASWQTGSGDHSKSVDFKTNIASEVRNWIFDHTSQTATGTTYYSAGTLFVNEMMDEDGNKVWEYKDKADKVILKKKRRDLVSSEYLFTYYVYDDFGRLCFVISPEAFANLSSVSYTIGYTGTFTDKWLFTYKYDSRDRITEKKVPAAAVIYNVYDTYNRLVLTQDGNQRSANQWSYTKYDALNRVLMTGIYSHGSALSQSAMQTTFTNNATTLNEYRTGMSSEYSNVVWPISSCEKYTIYYYDDYDFDNNGTADIAYQAQGLPEESVLNLNVKGFLTGAKVKILGTTSDWLKTANFYDYKKSIIQVQKNNHKNLASYSESETIIYDFVGNVLQNYKKHNPGSGNITILKKNIYDHSGRLLKSWHKINNGPETLISQLNYNEIGQMTEKNLHSEDNGGQFLQSIDFTYNIRKWFTNINGTNLSNDGIINNDNNDLFGLTLSYESGGSGKFNGNISSLHWRSANTNTNTQKFGYFFEYDGLNRIINSTSKVYFVVPNPPGPPVEVAGDIGFAEKGITYDKNGNILTLIRQVSSSEIDNLTYVYNGNQLSKCSDATSSSEGFKDGSNIQLEYTYDANGNMNLDANKGITSITYNYLNLPQTVTFSGSGNRIEYVYSAAGEKLSKKYYSNTTPQVTTDYISGIVYENNVLKCGKTVEGRFESNGSGAYKYVYDLKDHLGNVRMSFDKGLDGNAHIVQEDHYYPFGMTINSSLFSNRPTPPNDFLYNGKEREEELGFELYDYGARFYDPALCRWNTLDPLAMKYYALSPYAYCANNPVIFIDPDGREIVFAQDASPEFKAQFAVAIGYLNEKGVGSLLAILEQSDVIYTIKEGHAEGSFDPSTNTISWDPNMGILTTKGIVLSPTTVLNHEFDHAAQKDQNPDTHKNDTKQEDSNYQNCEEERVVTGSEQDTAKALGEIKEGEVTREDHKGDWIDTTGPTSTEYPY